MTLGYLLQPFFQLSDKDGKILDGGKIRVYKGNSTDPATTYSDFNMTINTWPIIVDSNGSACVIADSDSSYDVMITDRDDNLIFSRRNIVISHVESAVTINNETEVEGSEYIEVQKSHPSENVTLFKVRLKEESFYSKTQIDNKLQTCMAKPSGPVGTPMRPVFVNSSALFQECDGKVISDEDYQAFKDKQEKLISGNNIKTINGNSLLGSGNIEIQGGGGGISVSNVNVIGSITVPSGNVLSQTFGTGYSIPKGKTFIGVVSFSVAPMSNDLNSVGGCGLGVYVGSYRLHTCEGMLRRGFYTTGIVIPFVYNNNQSGDAEVKLWFNGTMAEEHTTTVDISGILF